MTMRRIIALAVILALAASFAVAAPDKIKLPQIALSLSFAGWAAADTALMIYGTSTLGLVETNKLLAPLFENRQYAAIWAIQVAGCAAIVAGCHALIHSNDKTTRIVGYVALVAMNAARAYIVVRNIRLHAKVS